MTRDDIMKQAIHNCMKEMYFKAQPSVDYDALIEKKKAKLIVDTHEDPIYNRYYLSQEEFEYIREKYITAYGFKSTWKHNVKLVEEYLINGGTKNKYIPSKKDSTGIVHPGYRSYEKVPSLIKQLTDILGEDKSKEVCNIVINNIKNCKDYYRFDWDENTFNFAIALGASPTSNKETVIKYWEEHGSPIEIVDRNPLLFWEMDEYGDEFEEVMEDEYGENWREIMDNKYKEEQFDD